jgi:predicted transposase YdaD
MKEFDKLITVDENLKEITEMITVYEERGIEKGLQKGIEQGMQQGMQKGRQEGILETARNLVLEALEVKFGTIPYSIKEKVLYCNDLNRLKQALRTAILIDSISKFTI